MQLGKSDRLLAGLAQPPLQPLLLSVKEHHRRDCPRPPVGSGVHSGRRRFSHASAAHCLGDIPPTLGPQALCYEPTKRLIRRNGGAPQRLVAATAEDALPLRALLGMDYTRPFNIAANAHTIAVLKEGHGSSGGQPTTLEFHSQPFDTGPRG